MDTNIWLRSVDPGASDHQRTLKTLSRLRSGEAELYLTSQTLVEFWAVSTRPIAANGLGWTTEQARQEIDELRHQFPVLPERDETLETWLSLVSKIRIQGKRTHDVRLAAVFLVHQLDYILTLNLSDFAGLPVKVVGPDEFS